MTDLDIINHPVHDRHNLFLDASKKIGVSCRLLELHDFTFHFDSVKPSTFLKNNKYDFPKSIYFYGGRNVYPIRSQLISLASQNRTTIFDKCLRSNPYWQISKFMESSVLTVNHIPIIPTWIISNQSSFRNNKYSFPIIAKLSNYSQGKGVFLCKDSVDIQNIFTQFSDDSLIIQPYIQNDGDYRVFVVGNTCLGAIKRVRKNLSEDFLNNASQGATMVQVELNSEMQKLALASSKCLEVDIAGVDLIENNGKLCVMEVNQAPQYMGFMKTTGIDVPYKIIDYFVNHKT